MKCFIDRELDLDFVPQLFMTGMGIIFFNEKDSVQITQCFCATRSQLQHTYHGVCAQMACIYDMDIKLHPRVMRGKMSIFFLRASSTNRWSWTRSGVSTWIGDDYRTHPCPNSYSGLKLLRPRKMAAISQTTFSNAFSLMKIYMIQISLNFVPKGPINNISALVQVMAWHRLGDKPLAEPIMVSLMTHICVTRSQWDNWLYRHV